MTDSDQLQSGCCHMSQWDFLCVLQLGAWIQQVCGYDVAARPTIKLEPHWFITHKHHGKKAASPECSLIHLSKHLLTLLYLPHNVFSLSACRL